MLDDSNAADVFAVPDFTEASKKLNFPEDVSHFFVSNLLETSTSANLFKQLRPGPWDLSNNSKVSTGDISKNDSNNQETLNVEDSHEENYFFKRPFDIVELPLCEKLPQFEPPIELTPKQPQREDSQSSNLNLDSNDDPWLSCDCVNSSNRVAEYKTWDLFSQDSENAVLPVPTAIDDDSLRFQQPIFITELGSAAFDAALAAKDDPFRTRNTSHKIVDTKVYCASLLALALGRDSIFFTWNVRKRSYLPSLDRLRISGFTGDVLKGVVKLCTETGNDTHYLRMFVEKAHAPATAGHFLTSSRAALATTVGRMLLIILSLLGERGEKARSLLHLESLVRPVHAMLGYFRSLVARLNRVDADEEMLSMLYQELQAKEYAEDAVCHVMRQVLLRVSRPWLEFVEQWIGTRVEDAVELSKDGLGRSFVKVQNQVWVDDMGIEITRAEYVLDRSKMPSFMAPDIAQKMFEAGKNLRFLKTYHPDHLLCHLDIIAASKPPGLKWHFEWEDFRAVEAMVYQYNKNLLGRFQSYLSGEDARFKGYETMEQELSPSPFLFFGSNAQELETRLATSMAQLSEPYKADITGEDQTLDQVLRRTLFDKDNRPDKNEHALGPHSSLVPILSFGPIIAAQAKLMDRECMRLLFSSHGLRHHIELQRDFQLMHNGLFCSRLSHALFDTDLEAAESQKGVVRQGGIMGLHLGGRDSWPPASSELRLALMGVLNECYVPPATTVNLSCHSQPVARRDKHKLPGDMSFAVRELSSAEIDAVMDSDSIAALDFLRLSYKPPTPLAPFITPHILSKYDRVFRLLLRVLRLLHVATQLSRFLADPRNTLAGYPIAMRFRVEIHHFVTALASYFFDTGIAGPWQTFSHWLDNIERELCESDDERDEEGLAESTKHVHGPDRLKEFHERVLDQILMALLLRRRQEPVMKLLEDMFRLILQFAKVVRLESIGGREQTSMTENEALLEEERQLRLRDEVARMYKDYKKKIDVFVTVCRALSEKGGFGVRTEKEMLSADHGSYGGLEDNVISRLLVRLEMRDYYAAGVAQ